MQNMQNMQNMQVQPIPTLSFAMAKEIIQQLQKDWGLQSGGNDKKIIRQIFKTIGLDSIRGQINATIYKMLTSSAADFQVVYNEIASDAIALVKFDEIILKLDKSTLCPMNM